MKGRRWTDVEEREEGGMSDRAKEIDGRHDLVSAKTQRSNRVLWSTEKYALLVLLVSFETPGSRAVLPKRIQPCRSTCDERKWFLVTATASSKETTPPITVKRGNTVPPLAQLSPARRVPPSPLSLQFIGMQVVWRNTDWTARLSPTCLLNDSNYFPGLQATHACFISTSTSPICLHGSCIAYTVLEWIKKNQRRKEASSSILFLPASSYGSPRGPPASSFRSLTGGGGQPFGRRGEGHGLTDVAKPVSWCCGHLMVVAVVSCFAGSTCSWRWGPLVQARLRPTADPCWNNRKRSCQNWVQLSFERVLLNLTPVYLVSYPSRHRVVRHAVLWHEARLGRLRGSLIPLQLS